MKKKLIGIFVCMLLITTVLSVSGTVIVERTSKPTFTGDTLYVGGSGPGNYSTIQKAVDAASNDDTVFVYDDSAPYYENVSVSKSITLFGEDKLTTIIDGSNGSNQGFSINTDHVTVTGFTIQNTGIGVHIGGSGSTASYNTITDNIILNTGHGVNIYYGNPSKPEFLDFGYNVISYNTIKNTTYAGIRSIKGRNNIISNNIITQNHGLNGSFGFGIMVSGAFNNVSHNNIYDNDMFGIYLTETYNTILYRNNITNNRLHGLSISLSSFDKIIENNFIGNHKNAKCTQIILLILWTHLGNYPILPITWKANYWDKPRSLPYPIPGYITILLPSSYLLNYYEIIPVNCIRFDWQPAQEPYDI